MKDIRPNLYISAQLARHYKSKKTNRLELSKKPKINLVVDRRGGSGACSYGGCREILIEKFNRKYRYEKLHDNKSCPGNPYVIYPRRIIKNKIGKPRGLKSTLGLEVKEDLNLLVKVCSDKEFEENITKTFNYILGILSVCMYHDDNEKKRRKELKVGLAKDVDVLLNDDNELTIMYNILSPLWVTSPILISIFVGLARNCLSIYYGLESKQLSELFKTKSYEDIEDIINNADYNKAYSFYKKHLKPFLLSLENDKRGFYITDKKHLKALEGMFDKDVSKVFRPHRMLNHWKKYGQFYGFNRFVSYLNNPRSKLLYELYRRI